MAPPDIQIVSQHPIREHGTTALRCSIPADALRALGHTVEVQTVFRTLPVARRAIILHRVRHDRHTQAFVDMARARGIPLIYDTDDLLFSPLGTAYLAKGPKAKQSRPWQSYQRIIAACDRVTVSTEYLADQLHETHGDVRVMNNVLSDSFLRQAHSVMTERADKPSGPTTLAYLSGSRSHDADFTVMAPALLHILERFPQVRLKLVGPLQISADFDQFAPQIIREEFRPYADYPHVFADIDINLVPLEVNEPFCQAKSELKFIEAGACGVVTVASPTAPHEAVINHGVNGVLAADGAWADELARLITDPRARHAMGQAARSTVDATYTTASLAPKWDQLLEALPDRDPNVSLGAFEKTRRFVVLHALYWRRRARRSISRLRRIRAT